MTIDKQILISAVICTYNRANYLQKALESLINQGLDCDKYEIIVVDNASTDQTANLVRDLSTSQKNLHYLHETTPGLSRARNKALEKAMGKYIAYLDDDAIASRDWLQNILKLFENNSLKISCLGGKVDPIWEAPRPAWLSDELLPFLSVTNISPTSRPITNQEFIVGANISFVRDELIRIGGFSELIGRKKNNLLSGEETEIVRKLQVLCKDSVFYSPEVVVGHHVHPSRVSKKWFILRYYWNGISTSLMEKNTPISVTRTNYLKLLVKTLLEAPCATAIYLLNKKKHFLKICHLSNNLGRLAAPFYASLNK